MRLGVLLFAGLLICKCFSGCAARKQKGHKGSGDQGKGSLNQASDREVKSLWRALVRPDLEEIRCDADCERPVCESVVKARKPGKPAANRGYSKTSVFRCAA